MRSTRSLGISLMVALFILTALLTSPVAAGTLVIDNFEDGNFSARPEWWVFGQIEPEVINDALSVSGQTQAEWYVGGLGCYIAQDNQDLSQYEDLQLDIYGYGPKSGTLKVELFDDDNGNWKVEQDEAKDYAPVYDDRFVAEINVDWQGWQQVVIPLEDFVDSNPKVGDGIWNPDQASSSGGLLQVQFICLASEKVGSVHYIIDDIKFAK
ncbi:hypothetical protein ACFL31_01945 [Candidatus Margulisiibacteriota bacterium]